MIKRGPQGETAYVNQFWTVRNREVGTKHIFAGGTRMVSKLVQMPREGQVADVPVIDCAVPWGWVVGNGLGLGRPRNPRLCNVVAGPEVFEKDQYYFHPDHLGSSSYVTDVDGEIYQHLEYFPFGETWIEEASNTQRTPYLFTGKELDEETGLYYFGARYYDPRTSVWQSPDPILARYMGGGPAGGVYVPANLSLFSYAHQKPVIATDPEGEFVWFIPLAYIAVEAAFTAYDVYDVTTTLMDEDASATEKAVSAGGLVAGIFLPGGGYSAADDVVGGVSSAVRRGSDDGGDILRRGDTRGPDQIHDEGFEPKAPGSDTSLEDYVDYNEPSDFVGTTKNQPTGDTSPGSPGEFATNGGQQSGYIYDIDNPGGGIDVNQAYPDGPFPHENEVVFPGGISNDCIIGCTPVNSSGVPVGDFIPNPNYVGLE